MIRLLSPIVRPLSFIVLVAMICLFTPTSSFSDSIKLNGKVYHNVYVSPGTSTHYLRFADDGTMVSVPNSEIDQATLVLSDVEARRQISLDWKAKRRATRNHKTMTYDEWRQSVMRQDEVPEATITERSKTAYVKPVTNANLSKKIARNRNRGGSSGQIKKFVDREGTSTLTNTPSYFEGKPEYLEVDLGLGAIEIPDKFIRTVGPAPDMETIDEIISYYAQKYDLEKSLVYAVIKQESNGNPNAVSSAGARGLMQLMPGTAQDMGVYKIFDPTQNIAGGTQYLSKMKKLFNDDVTLVLAGYNAGPGNVKKYNGVPPFKETQNYVRRVQQLQRQYERYGMPRFEKLASAKPSASSKTNRRR
jgi:hypothetical protein